MKRVEYGPFRLNTKEELCVMFRVGGKEHPIEKLKAFGCENVAVCKKTGYFKNFMKIGWVEVDGEKLYIHYDHIKKLKKYFQGNYSATKEHFSLETKQIKNRVKVERAINWRFTIKQDTLNENNMNIMKADDTSQKYIIDIIDISSLFADELQQYVIKDYVND